MSEKDMTEVENLLARISLLDKSILELGKTAIFLALRSGDTTLMAKAWEIYSSSENQEIVENNLNT